MSGHQQGSAEWRKLVVLKVHRQEEVARCAKAVSQAHQGQWMNWESMEKRKISWKDLWQIEAGRISFLLRATYNSLPSPTNLHQWLGKDPACRLYDMPATLRHIPTGCKVSLSQGRYTWRHDQGLKSPAAAVEAKRKATISNPLRTPVAVPSISFVSEGERKPRTTAPARKGQLEGTRDWEMFVDVSQQLIIPPYIETSTLRPEMVLWSNNLHAVYFIELTRRHRQGL